MHQHWHTNRRHEGRSEYLFESLKSRWCPTKKSRFYVTWEIALPSEVDILKGGYSQELLEVRGNIIDAGKLGEGPATILARSVDARQPVGLHRTLLLFGVFATVTLDFDD